METMREHVVDYTAGAYRAAASVGWYTRIFLSPACRCTEKSSHMAPYPRRVWPEGEAQSSVILAAPRLSPERLRVSGLEAARPRTSRRIAFARLRFRPFASLVAADPIDAVSDRTDISC